MSLSENMPLLARHEGVWEGFYRYYNQKGDKIDEHKSRLLCRIYDDKDYHQTNLYRWEDGKTETRDFPAIVTEGRLVFDTEIDGWAAAVELDTYKRTMMLNWVRKNEPGLYLYEMIQISDDSQSRSRVWHWYRDDRLFMRTLIDEVFISKDWAAYDGQDPVYAEMHNG